MSQEIAKKYSQAELILDHGCRHQGTYVMRNNMVFGPDSEYSTTLSSDYNPVKVYGTGDSNISLVYSFRTSRLFEYPVNVTVNLNTFTKMDSNTYRIGGVIPSSSAIMNSKYVYHQSKFLSDLAFSTGTGAWELRVPVKYTAKWLQRGKTIAIKAYQAVVGSPLQRFVIATVSNVVAISGTESCKVTVTGVTAWAPFLKTGEISPGNDSSKIVECYPYDVLYPLEGVDIEISSVLTPSVDGT